MARHIQSIIELSKAQTKEFLASLQNTENNASLEKILQKAKNTKFNVVR